MIPDIDPKSEQKRSHISRGLAVESPADHPCRLEGLLLHSKDIISALGSLLFDPG